MTEFEKEKDMIENTIEDKNLSYTDIQYFVKDGGRQGFEPYGVYENNTLFVSHGVDYACLSGSCSRDRLLDCVDNFFEGNYGLTATEEIKSGNERGVYPSEFGSTEEMGAYIIKRTNDEVRVFFKFEE